MADPAKREITAIPTDLPFSQFCDEVNKRLAQVEGMSKAQNQTYYELDQMRSGLGLDRYFNTRQAIGNTDDDYDDWTVHEVDDGYNIWRHTVDDYAYDPNNSLRRDEIVCDFMGEAVTDGSDPFDVVYLLSGGTYADHTAEAGTDEGTPFDLMGGTNAELLVGHGNIFSGIDFTFFKPGSGYALEHQYSQSTGWGSGSDILREDSTNNWRRDGLIRYNVPGDWVESDINGETKRWVRIKTVTEPTQKAQAYAVQPATNVKAMLSLSSEQLLKQGLRRWCSFGNTIYVTIRNQGDLRYHGNLHLQSGAGDAVKKAFFKTNHRYEADYKSSDWEPRLPARSRLTYLDDCASTLTGRYMNVGPSITGDQGHTIIRDGYLTGMGMSASIAPSGDDLNFVVRKNREGTLMSGTLLDGYNAAQKGDYDPLEVTAGDTVQVFCETTGSTAHRDVVVDIEHIEVDIG